MDDPKPLKNAGELFTQCRRQYGLTPEEVLGLLRLDNADMIGPRVSYEELLDQVKQLLTLQSGRILQPAVGHADLVKAVEDAERKAWQSLKDLRFQEFGHWAEIWATLVRVSGETRRNPFGTVAALGRRRYKP